MIPPMEGSPALFLTPERADSVALLLARYFGTPEPFFVTTGALLRRGEIKGYTATIHHNGESVLIKDEHMEIRDA